MKEPANVIKPEKEATHSDQNLTKCQNNSNKREKSKIVRQYLQ